VFYFTFWPHGYVVGYWAYAYDDFFDTLFWGGGAPYSPYIYAYAAPRPRVSSRRAATRDVALTTREVRQLCADPGQGVTAWPIEQIEKAVEPTDAQDALLDQVRTAAAQASEAFKASCPTTLARTPPGRLEAMVARIEATLEAVRIVRPALAAFYDSLTDEQKARFNEIGPKPSTADEAASDDDKDACPDPKPGLAALPMNRIHEVVRPTEAQQTAFDQLGDAAENAVTTLQAACPDFVPQTPVGRLEAMEARLGAMLEAAHVVQPALQAFYDSLGNEQKARFNALGRELARTEG
jgi:hypothetical protein